jgi:hypothetical protein
MGRVAGGHAGIDLTLTTEELKIDAGTPETITSGIFLHKSGLVC